MITLLDIDAVGAPVVALIDGSGEGLEAASLKARARALGRPIGARAVSRSYAPPYALVGWHSGPVGVDIERVVSCDEQFARSICTPTERARSAWGSDRDVVSLWSGKEALAKALGDAVRYDPRRLESPASWSGGASGPWRAATLTVPDGYCAWVCWRPPGPSPADRPARSGERVLRLHHEGGRD